MTSDLPAPLAAIHPDRPVLIAGPTASGKSALALALAQRQGRTIVNADALQVHGAWRVLTARPSAADEARAAHTLYGHVGWGAPYSVGHWLREVAPLLGMRPAPVVVGGTGLFLTALTEGLAPIPEADPAIRAEADARMARLGVGTLAGEIDAPTRARIDPANPARVQRAWEVLRQTGRGLADWQDATPPPPLPLAAAAAFVIDAPKDRLLPFIESRFDRMLEAGALDEVREVLPSWDARLPAAKAIGAPELVAYLRGEMALEEARSLALIATRRYAKRQRTWFRSRMGEWTRIPMQTSGSP